MVLTALQAAGVGASVKLGTHGFASVDAGLIALADDTTIRTHTASNAAFDERAGTNIASFHAAGRAGEVHSHCSAMDRRAARPRNG